MFLSIALLIFNVFLESKSLPVNDIANSVSTSVLVAPLVTNLGEVNRRSSHTSNFLGLLPSFPDAGRKHAVHETESFISQIDTAYGKLHEIVQSLVHHKPVVDTLYEHEKYGNDGGKIRLLGTMVVNGYEGLSNVINKAIDTPQKVVHKVGNIFRGPILEVGRKLIN